MNRPAFALEDTELAAAALHAQLLARRRGTFEHDFKNIMHGLLSGTDLLEKALGASAPRITPTECLKLLQQQLGRTQGTFARILEEIAPAAAAPECDLSVLLEECAHDLRHDLQRLQLASEIEPALSVLVPHERLKDVLLAFLFDAMDRSPPHGPIDLSAVRDGERARVRIRHSCAAGSSSALARTATAVADALGMETDIDERDGVRRIELRAPIAHKTESTAPKLLIVDTNRDAADSLALLVQLEGFQALAVYDISTARRQAREWNPDFILVDADGAIDVAGFAREARTLGWKIFGLSHTPEPRTAKELTLLRKPLDPAALRALVTDR